MRRLVPTDYPVGADGAKPVGILLATLNLGKEHAMSKTLEVISEAIRNPNHPFRKVETRPKKAKATKGAPNQIKSRIF